MRAKAPRSDGHVPSALRCFPTFVKTESICLNLALTGAGGVTGRTIARRARSCESRRVEKRIGQTS